MKKQTLFLTVLCTVLFFEVPVSAHRTEPLSLRDTTPVSSTTYTQFRDVPSNHWGKDGISYVVDKGIFYGTGEDTFSPDEPMNLAMLCTVLHRFAGSPSPEEDNLFTDFATRNADYFNQCCAAIKKDEWYSDGMVWALKNEILDYERKFAMKDDVQTALDPNAILTRKEFCEMLRNYYAYRGGGRVNDYIATFDTGFLDVQILKEQDQYAGVMWAYTYGIVKGTSNVTISPDIRLNRVQTATMLERYARQFGTGKPIDPPLSDGYGEYGETYSNNMIYMFGATDDKGVEARFIHYINANRAKNGLSALPVNDKLMDAADIRARELTGNFAHTRTDGLASPTLLQDAGLTGWTLLYEINENSSYMGVLEDSIDAASGANSALMTTDADVEMGVSYLRYGAYPMVVLVARRGPDAQAESIGYTDATTTAPAQPVSQDAARQLTIAGKVYTLGMTEAELTALAGQPDAKVSSSEGSTWYIFGTDTYLDFFLADVLEGRVVRLASCGKAFSYQGTRGGAMGVTSSDSNVTLYKDVRNGNVLHTVVLREPVQRTATFDAASLRGESIVNFHMTNAFRVFHGLAASRWSEAAATSARLHSEDMAKQNYCSRHAPDGSTPWIRMDAQGIPWKTASEIISTGESNGIAVFAAWVDNPMQRDGLLCQAEEAGVGAGYNAASTYLWYMTRDSYNPA